MTPARVKSHTYNTDITYPAEFDIIKAQDRQLGTDFKLMRKMLLTSHYHDPMPPDKPQLHLTSNYVQLYAGGAQLTLLHRVLEGDFGAERLDRPSLNNHHYTLATRRTGPSHASNAFWPGGPSL